VIGLAEPSVGVDVDNVCGLANRSRVGRRRPRGPRGDWGAILILKVHFAFAAESRETSTGGYRAQFDQNGTSCSSRPRRSGGRRQGGCTRRHSGSQAVRPDQTTMAD
jgi:hypothetical protein